MDTELAHQAEFMLNIPLRLRLGHKLGYLEGRSMDGIPQVKRGINKMKKIPKLTYPIKLDIGCGFYQYKKTQGYIGIDIKDFGQEIIWDITNGLPFPDSSIKNFFCCHVLEHLSYDMAVSLFKEIWRTGTDKAELELRMPSISNRDAFAGDHQTRYTSSIIEYMLKEFNAEHSLYQFSYPKLEEVSMPPYDEVQALIIIEKDKNG